MFVIMIDNKFHGECTNVEEALETSKGMGAIIYWMPERKKKNVKG